MVNVLLIFAGAVSVFMGITGRYQQVLAVLVTGWKPNAGSNSQSRTGGSSGSVGANAV